MATSNFFDWMRRHFPITHMDSKVQQLLSEASSLVVRFQQETDNIIYLDDAIVLGRDALTFCPPGHPRRSVALTQLSSHLSRRYDRYRGVDDLDEAIMFGREALALCSPGDAGRSGSLSDLALHLSARYILLGRIEDLDEAISLSRDALVLCPPGHPGRSTCLSNCAAHLFVRYNQLGQLEELDEVVLLSHEALELCPIEHPDRPKSLIKLSAGLFARYNHLGRLDDLDEAIVLSRGVLELYPPEFPGRSVPLGFLAAYLSTRYKRLGEIDDLNAAITFERDALALCPPDHPDRLTSLSNLALHLLSLYNDSGGIDNLDEAIVLGRDALELCPPGHPGRSAPLNNLALYLSTRYDQIGGIDDLDEAIVLSRNALTVCPPGHAGRPACLNNLASHFFTRYDRLRRADDVDEAISLERDSLALCPPGHPERPTYLNNLSTYLSTRYDHLGGLDDLHEAIILGRDALELCPLGHPGRSTCLNNLTSHLVTRYTRLESIHDLDEAIVFGRSALGMRPLGHPKWSHALSNLAQCLLAWPSRLGGSESQEELFSLYSQLEDVSHTVSLSDLAAAREWVNMAENFHHPMTLLAYETALRLLVEHMVTLPSLPQHLSVIKTLSSSLAVDAFSACLRNQSPTKAVELAEQGRGVFWSQRTRLRSPLDDVIASGTTGEVLADDFTRLTSAIRNVLDVPSPDQHDRVCRLNLELQRLVSNIRVLPGLSRFLLPPMFSDLRRAASDGPVIMVNASRFGCDALVVFIDRDPVHIPLSITKNNVQDMSSRIRTLTKLAKSTDVTRGLGIVLRELWDDVVSHIVDVLRTTHALQSRIWWCPTEFSLLPLHAAGPFRKGQQNLSDLYISSYTPTLTALIRARRPSVRTPTTDHRHFTAIGEATASGAHKLACVGSELTTISELVGAHAIVTRIEGVDACISRVAHALRTTHWVHFACHGLPNRKAPFESAFALHDGAFTLQHLLRCDMQQPEFAYLSACHTTVGDEESPDEMLHLASAMQIAGFRSVIGTMWAVDDAETNKMTSVFYRHMVDASGHLDYTRAASALRKTIKSVDAPFDQRILYVHLGA